MYLRPLRPLELRVLKLYTQIKAIKVATKNQKILSPFNVYKPPCNKLFTDQQDNNILRRVLQHFKKISPIKSTLLLCLYVYLAI